ncbi:type II secretion system F family protein [Sinimarinibacterium sp. CAU 1509]|uniref:type II secretion system F family protein n=1 Tax=Sinimarinibacterium sp. CAU 1509 TaxID=2562283 RepID=UPI0010AD2C3F|nr:type II secretion system F family protein [Sinimarinibacterium sp. CAU 1509]TJY56707.1 type II secretion system F family protein [Sinimarinibacterium sp. CAU 1509]
MSPAVFALIVSLAVLVAVIGVLAAVTLGLRARGTARIRRRLTPDDADVSDFEDVDQAPVIAAMARGGRAMEAWVDSEGESNLLLLRAGWRSGERRLMWYVFQAVLPFALFGLVLAYWLFAEIQNKGLILILLLASAAVLSFLAPRWILRAVAAARQRRIKSEVPLLIHLLVLLFEAGLSIRQALSSLVREGGGVLPELGREVEIVIRQLDAGAETSEALKNLSDVLAVEDLTTVLATLRQVDRYGGEIREPLLEVLDVIEERRSLDLRERVNHMSGRMTVVMVLFFFPALMIFVAGPAFLSIIRALAEVNAK